VAWRSSDVIMMRSTGVIMVVAVIGFLTLLGLSEGERSRVGHPQSRGWMFESWGLTGAETVVNRKVDTSFRDD
jgi:succinate dehydrogenase hydrophobic anchor subunit